jgi:hypothetical protein
MLAGAIVSFVSAAAKSLEANEFGKNGYMGAVLRTFDERDARRQCHFAESTTARATGTDTAEDVF